MTGARRDPLGSHRGFPLTLFSATPWRATGYLASYLLTGTGLFIAALGVVLVSGVVSISWLGVPLLIGAAGIVRGCAQLERMRTVIVGERIPASYRPVLEPGILAQARTRWTDWATIRDCTYLILLFPFLLLLDVVALALWLACLAGVALPFWYWSLPNGQGVLIGYFPDGRDGVGIRVDDLLTAVLTAAGFLVIALFLAYVVVAAAKLHRAVARSMLRPYVDPLADARRMLAEPGPLRSETR